jgi:hypothetical protein
MRNHFHLVLETPNANLVEGMRWFGSELFPPGRHHAGAPANPRFKGRAEVRDWSGLRSRLAPHPSVALTLARHQANLFIAGPGTSHFSS